jgi:hypothetical protein
MAVAVFGVGGAGGPRRDGAGQLQGDRLPGRQGGQGPGVGGELKVTPAGRFGLVMLVRPWVGRVSTTLRLEASEGPVLETTIV